MPPASHGLSPRNGGFWVFYGALACVITVGLVGFAYMALVVRPADVDLIIQTKAEAVATKKAFDDRVVGRTPEGFHRADMREWCQAFAEANWGKGIACPNPYELPGYASRR